MTSKTVLDKTKDTVVAKDVRVAGGIWSRFWGLMGRRALPEGSGLLLTPCSSVHTFFMRFPIDVLFLDRERRVVKLVPAMRPFRMALGGGGREALELGAGEAARAGVEAGDLLEITDREQRT